MTKYTYILILATDVYGQAPFVCLQCSKYIVIGVVVVAITEFFLIKGVSVGLCDGILRQKNDHGVRGAPTVVCRKSVVESQRAVRPDNLGYAIHDALVRHLPRDWIRSLGHEPALDQIERHGKEGGRETGTQRRQDARR